MTKDMGASEQDLGASADADRATRQSPSPASGLGPDGRVSASARDAITAAAEYCAGLCETFGRALEAGPVGPDGWPETAEGGARHQSFALADQIRDSLRFGGLSVLIAQWDGSPEGGDTRSGARCEARQPGRPKADAPKGSVNRCADGEG